MIIWLNIKFIGYKFLALNFKICYKKKEIAFLSSNISTITKAAFNCIIVCIYIVNF